MQDDGKLDDLRLGFLASIEVSERGYVGGLLVTNRFGRPLEFQCTSPVKPNRSQQILYGETLVPYILSDLIGRTLLEKVSIKPHIVLTEQSELLELRELVSVPIGCLEEHHDSENESDDSSASDPETDAEGVVIGRQRLRFHSAHVSDSKIIERHRPFIPADADLAEPLERVREALAETSGAGAAR